MTDFLEALEIRKARASEAMDIWRVTRQAFLPYKDIIKPEYGALKVTANAIRRQIRKKERVYIGVWYRGELVATIRYKKYAKYLAISRLAVLPEYQNYGLGKLLMQRVEQEAKRLRVWEIRGDVRTALPRLMMYYERMGYKPYKMRSVPGYKDYIVAIKKNLRNTCTK